ncbi:MAG TPA: glucosamine-6-phosphate deaminase [Dongiaceae bacterium]
MQLTWLDNPTRLAEEAAHHVAALLAGKPTAALALPTGNTPLGLYRQLVKMQERGEFSCDQASFFNLDEFVGKSLADEDSYASFLWRHCFHPLAIRPDQVRLLQGDAGDLAAECRSFDQAIAAAGGLDLAILGLGTNGHVAFNEPGSDWEAPTREVVLATATKQAQQGLYADETDVPPHGLTMGVATIRSARSILLLVSGSNKAAAVAALLRGTPDEHWPVTAILDHPQLTVLADRKLQPQHT